MSVVSGRTDERGAVATEVVIITPLLLLLLMLVVQFAMWQHAGHIAKTAALEGARAARLQDGTADAGRMKAEGVLAQLGQRSITSPTVVVSKDGTVATVTVTGYADEVVPGMRLPVKATSSGPLEVMR